jgi:hypothetical protein
MNLLARDERQWCNQCRGTNHTYYCAPTDEYLCEECEVYALKMVAEEENRELEGEEFL